MRETREPDDDRIKLGIGNAWEGRSDAPFPSGTYRDGKSQAASLPNGLNLKNMVVRDWLRLSARRTAEFRCEPVHRPRKNLSPTSEP